MVDEKKCLEDAVWFFARSVERIKRTKLAETEKSFVEHLVGLQSYIQDKVDASRV